MEGMAETIESVRTALREAIAQLRAHNIPSQTQLAEWDRLASATVTVTLTSENVAELQKRELVAIEGALILLHRQELFATGAAIHDFYLHHWDNDYYYESDNAELQIEDEDNGHWLLKDDQIYDLRHLGTLHWQGSQNPKTVGKEPWMKFEEAFLKWKARTT